MFDYRRAVSRDAGQDGQRIYCNRPEVILHLDRVCGPRAGSAHNQPCRCRPEPQRQNDLPCRVDCAQIANFGCKTASAKLIAAAVVDLFDRIANPDLLVRRLTMSANGVVSKEATGRGRNEPIGGHRVWQTAKHSLHHDTLLLKKNRSGQKEKGKRMDDKKWKTDMLKYKDMFDLARPEPIRPRVPVADRAAQFAPFAALTNYGEEIQKVTERVNGEEGSSNA